MAEQETQHNPVGVKPQYVHEPLPKPLPTVRRVRHRRNLRNLLVITLPLLLIAVAAGYMASPWSKVALIAVQGTNVVANQDVIDATKMNAKTYIPAVILQDKQLIKQTRKAVPALKRVKLTMQGLRNVKVTVAEYKTVGYVTKRGVNHAVLSNGTILTSESAQTEQGLPLFSGFTSDLKAIIKTVAQIPTAISQDISEVTATRGNGNPHQVTITMNDGNKIIADSRTLVKKIKYYPNMVAQVHETGTIDLEVGAFFVPKNGK